MEFVNKQTGETKRLEDFSSAAQVWVIGKQWKCSEESDPWQALVDFEERELGID